MSNVTLIPLGLHVNKTPTWFLERISIKLICNITLNKSSEIDSRATWHAARTKYRNRQFYCKCKELIISNNSALQN